MNGRFRMLIGRRPRVGLGLAGALIVLAVATTGSRAVATNTPARAGAPGCQARDVRLSLASIDEAMFHLTAVYVITNRGRRACALEGVPTLSVFHVADGNALVQRVPVDISPSTDAAMRTVVLRRGGEAGFVVSYGADPSRSRPCPDTVYDVTLPGTRKAITVTDTIPICPGARVGRILTVSAVLSADSLPQPASKS